MRRRIIRQAELDRPKARRIVVVLGAGALIALAAAWAAGLDADERRRPTVAPAQRPADRLRTELLRCNELGQPALEDYACRAAWAENRRRFFGNREEPRR